MAIAYGDIIRIADVIDALESLGNSIMSHQRWSASSYPSWSVGGWCWVDDDYIPSHFGFYYDPNISPYWYYHRIIRASDMAYMANRYFEAWSRLRNVSLHRRTVKSDCDSFYSVQAYIWWINDSGYAYMNSGYTVQLPEMWQVENWVGEIIRASDVNGLLNSMYNEWAGLSGDSFTHTICHSSCHHACHCHRS